MLSIKHWDNFAFFKNGPFENKKSKSSNVFDTVSINKMKSTPLYFKLKVVHLFAEDHIP